MQIIDIIRKFVRKIMRKIAKNLNTVTKGNISPDTITYVGLLAHIPIALLIAYGYLAEASVLLIVFGLFDTLDGELARLQNKASPAGMLLDASTDRMKEVLLYTGVAYYISSTSDAKWAFLAVIACGASLCVSYIKAKGESAVATSHKKPNHTKLNRMFGDGLATFEVRIALLVLGLALDQLVVVVGIIAILATYTAIKRLFVISKYLND